MIHISPVVRGYLEIDEDPSVSRVTWKVTRQKDARFRINNDKTLFDERIATLQSHVSTVLNNQITHSKISWKNVRLELFAVVDPECTSMFLPWDDLRVVWTTAHFVQHWRMRRCGRERKNEKTWDERIYEHGLGGRKRGIDWWMHCKVDKWMDATFQYTKRPRR